MKKEKLRKPPAAVLVALIAVIAAVGTTVAWLTAGQGLMDRFFSLSNFDTKANIWFEGESPITKNSDGTITVDVINQDAANYIGKLRVNALYTGRGKAYLRVKMIQQWTDAGGTVLNTNVLLPFVVSSPYLPDDTGDQNKWFDNRLDDYCFYYAAKISSSANGTYDTIPVIVAGLDTDRLAAVIPGGTVTLKIAVTLEAVQVNRYPQFWGIDTLPWRS